MLPARRDSLVLGCQRQVPRAPWFRDLSHPILPMKCLSIHLTDLCNSECVFCVVGAPLHTTDTVRYQDIVAFLEASQGQGFEVVNLHGGEPTIHPRFLETLDRIRQLGYREVHVQTNGIQLADIELMRKASEKQVTKIILSLHGDTAELHEAHTYTPGGFDKVVQSIRNAKACGIHVRTNTVITRLNMSRLAAIATLAYQVGVDHLNLSAMHPVGSARYSAGRLLPRLQELRPFLEGATSVAMDGGLRTTLEGFPYCTLDGGLERLHLGNEHRSIRLLIGEHIMEDYDTFMRQRMRIMGEPCHECRAAEICGGVYPEYVAYYGWDEFDAAAVPGGLCLDPTTS
jgi:MoaA/NifB/PqqE/SkfB family radical SAM enzyme